MTLRTALAFVLAVAACSDKAPPPQCGGLTPPQCPADNGADVCQDVTCASVYACENGAWVFVESCPNYSPDAGVHPVDASAETSSTSDVFIDAPPGAYGGPGCTDLEQPDCSLGTALACANTPDCCGCEDLYVCVNGGWEPWGECMDGGISPSGH